ncbi:MAG: sigma-70 family RNA polymerase sigma factor [Spirochaetales bacterium]|nr:MAG: sigma-70 family RNA polymerase sigma factor [Spirochaetales bacterium]
MMIDVEALYRKYGPMVFRRCMSLLKNQEKALDAMQDVFVQLLRKREDLQETGPSSLLYRIATNICLNYLRSWKRKPETADDDLLAAIAGYDDPARLAEGKHLLDSIFMGEAEGTRTMAVLHYVDGLTLEETAQQAGLSVSGVRKRLRKLKANSDKLKEAYHNA